MLETTTKKARKTTKRSRRTKPSHVRYNANGQRDKNKARHILKEIKKHPQYKCPESANKEVKNIVKIEMAKRK